MVKLPFILLLPLRCLHICAIDRKSLSQGPEAYFSFLFKQLIFHNFIKRRPNEIKKSQ